ncbi:DUF2076 domain-containing protein [Cupriavidus sp. TMH.W2]|uniref:DUF2076 domain-containing protein n=1 Tax=Cupriavidus sp. TMH.W2 TaxID=3434465 RepID=UPI003D77FB92
MTPQDTQALEVFLTQLTQTRAGAKDPQAEALIAQAVAIQPDAAYLLVQRAMLLDHALSTAKAQIAALQGQLQAAQANGSRSFIDQQYAWGASANPAAPAPVPAPAQSASPALQPAPPQSPRPGFLSGGFGSTLGTIATTAAGVAGGAFLFQGIENLFGHSSKNGFLGQSGMNSPGTETNIVNNYYGNDDQASVAARNWDSDNGNLDAGLSDDGFLDDDSTLS